MKKNEILLTIDQAYDAMFDFLENYYKKTNSDDLGGLLGSMTLLADGRSIDRAISIDWYNLANKKLQQNNTSKKNNLSIKQTYDAMIEFLSEYYFSYNTKESRYLHDEMTLNNNITTSPIWSEWLKSVTKILNSNPQTRPYFQMNLPNTNQAYNAAIIFLEEYCGQVASPDIRSLLENMTFSDRKSNGDPKAISLKLEWQSSCNLVLSKRTDIYPPQQFFGNVEGVLTYQEAFEILFIFLEKYNLNNKSEAINKLRNNMFLEDGSIANSLEWELWENCISKVVHQK